MKKNVTKLKQNAELRNNPIFGKLIENPMNKVEVKIVATTKQYLKLSFRLILIKKKNNFIVEQ